MIQKTSAALAVLAFVSLATSVTGQTNQPAQAHPPGSPSISAPAATQALPTGPTTNATTPSGSTDCFGGNCDIPQPHISIATPAPAPAPWTWPERVLWGAILVLVVLGYVAILLAVSLLRKIERQGRYAEEAAQAAGESARASLKHAEALERAERPWILMSIRPMQNLDNGFTVIAMNRGRGPAQIVNVVDEIVCAVNETRLDATPKYREQAAVPTEPIILMPGEKAELVSFSRNDVRQVCVTEERLKRVEDWEERIYLYGKVTYRSLVAPDDAPTHESSWFCWYIHGQQKSGMVMAGSPAYNRHT